MSTPITTSFSHRLLDSSKIIYIAKLMYEYSDYGSGAGTSVGIVRFGQDLVRLAYGERADEIRRERGRVPLTLVR